MQFDHSALFKRLGPQAEQKLAYAAVNTLNRAAIEMQRILREHVLNSVGFDVRQRAFIAREAAKIERQSFASVARGQAFVEIGVGHKPRLLLSEFEEGGKRLPFVGSHVAMPVIGGPARRTRRSRVPKRFTFEQLNFIRGRSGTWVGQQRTYLIPDVGVFQRGARSKAKGHAKGRDSVMLYAFVDPFQLRARLDWLKTARRVAGPALKRFMEDEARIAVLRARSVV